ncbi:ATP-binding protein [Pseudoruegeria sp. HB172150]|uniref:sensor histidine kinase n=1 Tax=Pseudoruegeria sp. HB172150 TaxID=2721164 RepID=UPI001552A23D|nr:ATP-binding protein [Pseudoruegeria sp. HB172150]
MGRALRSPKSTKIITAIALLIATAMLVLASMEIERLIYRNYLQDLKLDTTIELIEIREEIEEAVVESTLKIQDLAFSIASHPGMDQATYERAAAGVFGGNKAVLNVAAAPGLVIRYIYPREGNEAAIGLDYNTTPSQLPEVMEAVETKSAQVAGPVDLVQGGLGIIMRQPVFLRNSGNDGAGALWGIVSLVLDIETFFADIGLHDTADTLDVFVASVGPDGTVDRAIYGDPAIADRDPVRLEFDFSGGDWVMMATTAGGWPKVSPTYLRDYGLMGLVGLLILGTLGYLIYSSESRRLAQRRFANAIQAMDSGFAMYDPDGRLTAFNVAYVTIYQPIESHISRGARYEDLVRAGVQCRLVDVPEGEEEQWVQDQLAAFGKDTKGHIRRFSTGRSIKSVDLRTESGDVVCMRIDVTELNEAKAQAEAANRAKTGFLSTLSHELRTPMTVIYGVARFLQNADHLQPVRALAQKIRDPRRDADAMERSLDELVSTLSSKVELQTRSCDRLMFLIDELLDYAAIDAGTLRANLQPCTVRELLDAVSEQMRPLAENKNLVFEVQCEAEDVWAEFTHARQILLNLVGNAIKFTDAGNVRISARPVGETVEFAVSDSGVGIRAEDLASVFRPFHQLDATDIRKHGGTGIGLTVSRELARAQGGDIRVESSPGIGSTFTFTLKAVQYEQTPFEGKR